MSIAFEYDPEKSSQNEEKHGIDFIRAQTLWKVPHVIILAKNISGEHRYAILGKIHERVHVAIFTYRGTTVRLISCHKGDARRERDYERLLHEKKEN